MTEPDSGLSAEDAKLVALARGARGRVGAAESASDGSATVAPE